MASTGLCGGLYVVSFFLPVTAEIVGYQAFGLSAIWPALWPACFANLLFVGGLVLYRCGSRSAACKAATGACLLAVFGVLVLGGLGLDGFRKLGPGFWTWLGAMLGLAVGSAVFTESE